MQAAPTPGPGLQVPTPVQSQPPPGRYSQTSLSYAPSQGYATTVSPTSYPGGPPQPPGPGRLYQSPGPPLPPGSMGQRPGSSIPPVPTPIGQHPGMASGTVSMYPTPQPGYQMHARKRLVVCCDGTWLDSDAGVSDDLQVASNVTRIGRAVKPMSSDGVAQVVYYQAGLGTDGGYFSRLAGGATADGLAGNIREAYAFICLNWDPGDEIFLVGFSRGAFTARSVAGLIGQVGVLTKAGLKDLAVIFQDVQMRSDPKYESKYPGVPFPDKPSASDPRYAREMGRLGLTRLGARIKAIAVWDTVGSLGIPRVPWLERIGLQKKSVRDYSFYDTSLGPYIENAFQALALDEMRSSFVPTLWEQPRPPRDKSRNDSQPSVQPPPQQPRTNLRQVWFSGVHSNIGGGYPDPGQANITMAWMIAQLEPLVDFDFRYLQAQWASSRTYYANTNQPPRPWSFGEIYRSMTGLYSLAGATVRTPGRYYRLDPRTGAPTRSRLRDTGEYIHPSVRARTELEGPGTEDRGVYSSKALGGYRLRLTGARHGTGRPVAVWESTEQRRRSKGGDGGPRRVIEESPLFATELALLRGSPWVEQALFDANNPNAKSRRTAGGAAQDTFGTGSQLSGAPSRPQTNGGPASSAADIGYVAPTGRRRSEDDARLPSGGAGALAGEGRRRRKRSPGRKDKERRHSTRT